MMGSWDRFSYLILSGLGLIPLFEIKKSLRLAKPSPFSATSYRTIYTNLRQYSVFLRVDCAGQLVYFFQRCVGDFLQEPR